MLSQPGEIARVVHERLYDADQIWNKYDRGQMWDRMLIPSKCKKSNFPAMLSAVAPSVGQNLSKKFDHMTLT